MLMLDVLLERNNKYFKFKKCKPKKLKKKLIIKKYLEKKVRKYLEMKES